MTKAKPISYRAVIATLLWLVGAGAIGLAAEERLPNEPASEATSPPSPPLPSPPLPPEASELTNMIMRPVGPGVFEVGKVRFNKRDRSVTFPAVLNMREGMLEYFLVAGYGKVHESVLRTEAQPYHIHLAMLLLDAQGAPPSAAPVAPPSPPNPGNRPQAVENPSTELITGDKVSLELNWLHEGKPVRCRAEDLVFNLAAKAPMTRGPWVYNGSLVAEGTFLAQRDGQVIALINDPCALMNNPRPGSENDEIWTTNTNRLPVLGTPVEVTITLEKDELKTAPRPAR